MKYGYGVNKVVAQAGNMHGEESFILEVKPDPQFKFILFLPGVNE
jgi:hypothetical protein